VAKQVGQVEQMLRQKRQEQSLPTAEAFRAMRFGCFFDRASARCLDGIIENAELRYQHSAHYQVATDKFWPAAVAASLLGQTQTNAQGQFTIDVQPGSYVLYAIYRTEFVIAEWAIPVNATQPGSCQLDLTNENADVVNR
jgi:hypothetical protein